MSRTTRTVRVNRPVDRVASFLSDFSTSAEWDPHTRYCDQLTDGPVHVGTRFRNVQRIAGHDTALEYAVTHYEPGRRIVLEGGNATVRTGDEMTFAEDVFGRTTVTYVVDVQLQGRARLAQLLVPLMMRRVADQGRVGMRKRLERL